MKLLKMKRSNDIISKLYRDNYMLAQGTQMSTGHFKQKNFRALTVCSLVNFTRYTNLNEDQKV